MDHTKDDLEEDKITDQEMTDVNEEEQSENEENSEEPIEETVSIEDELQSMKEKYLRLVAEFDNYRKRTNRERLDLISTAGENTISKILPVLDDFDRAKKSAEDDKNDEVFTEGVSMVYGKLFGIMNQMGLKSMETAGEEFNPEFHEALTEIPVPEDDMKGKIVDTIEKGYILNDKIIRYAKVVVGK